MVPAGPTCSAKEKAASCSTGSPTIAANGGDYAGVDVQGKTTRRKSEICRGRVGRSVAAYVWSACAAKLTSLTGWNGLVVRRCSIFLKSRNAIALRAPTDAWRK